jgi:hypothetical protein
MINLVTRTAVFGAMLTAAAAAAFAQSYASDGGNYLRLPQGYQQAPQMQGGRAVYNGQGMGQGQLQSQTIQPQSMQPLAGGAVAVQPTVSTAVASNASARMLPPGAMMETQQSAQPPMQPMQQQPSMQPAVQTNNVMLTQPPIIQPLQAGQTPRSATQPVVMSHQNGIAGSMPMPTVATMNNIGDQTNVQLRPACDTPNNHRANNKGLNTSTTVHGDCLD